MGRAVEAITLGLFHLPFAASTSSVIKSDLLWLCLKFTHLTNLFYSRPFQKTYMHLNLHRDSSLSPRLASFAMLSRSQMLEAHPRQMTNQRYLSLSRFNSSSRPDLWPTLIYTYMCSSILNEGCTYLVAFLCTFGPGLARFESPAPSTCLSLRGAGWSPVRIVREQRHLEKFLLESNFPLLTIKINKL